MTARPAVLPLLQQLCRSRSREEIERFQIVRLRRLLTHAQEHVPYYRRLFDQHGIRPREIRSLADIDRLPITSKADLQGLPPGELLAAGVPLARLRSFTTSGSSGQPFTVWRGWLERKLVQSFQIRALRSFGVKPTDRIVEISLLRRVVGSGSAAPRRALPWGAYRPQRIDVLAATEETVRSLVRLRPHVISGYAGALADLASRLSPEARERLRPRLVVSGAEVLTPSMRRQIAEGFGAPVYDWYGSFEFGLIAWECRATGVFHVCDESLILEVLRDGRAAACGERGEVVATSLHYYTMPFIRYRLGDLVTREEGSCRCGRPFSTIGSLQGRMVDYFRLPGGRWMHPYEIVHRQVKPVAWVGQYQLIQEREDRIRLRIVPRGTPPVEEVGDMEAGIRRIVGPDVELRLELVAEIPLETTGKFRAFRSLVSSAYDEVVWDREAPGRDPGSGR